MKVFSINVGRPREIASGNGVRKTGIWKTPVAGPIEVTTEGLAGDAVCDTRYHGGDDQAVYVYTQPDYDWWSRPLGRDLAPGTFGENLTIGGLESANVVVGDRLIVAGRGPAGIGGGMVILEATAPRIPCATFAGRMDDPAFVRRFREAERPGFYCRVIVPGFIQALDPMEIERYSGPTLSMLEMFREYYDRDTDEASIRRHLAAPVAVRHRLRKERELADLMARTGESRPIP